MEYYTIGKNYFQGARVSLKSYQGLSYIPECPRETVFQIVIIESGSGIIQINDKRAIIHAPVIYYVNELETVTLEEATDIQLHIIYFHPSIIDITFDFNLVREFPRNDVANPKVQDLFLLNEFIFRDQIFKDHSQLTQAMLHKLTHFIDGIQDEFNNQRTYFWMCRGRSYFLEMLCYLSKLQTADTPDLEMALNSDNDTLENALLYIHTNYADKITLNSLVENFHINRTTLNELFKKQLGESVMSYIIRLRIEISALMLRDTGIPIQEIAYRIGFEDSGHYGRTFKRLKGCSPTKYREEYSWLLRLC